MKSKIKKAKIKKAKKSAKGKVYPYLGQAKDGTVILFTEGDEGFVVHAGEGTGNYLGESGYWDESDFKRVTKKVVLSND